MIKSTIHSNSISEASSSLTKNGINIPQRKKFSSSQTYVNNTNNLTKETNPIEQIKEENKEYHSQASTIKNNKVPNESNETNNFFNEHDELQSDQKYKNIDDLIDNILASNRPENIEVKDENKVPHKDKGEESINQFNSKIKTQTTKHDIKKFEQYDLQMLAYDIVKEYSHFKADKNVSFMKRMLFDIYKRHSKEDRVNKLIEINKIKINENERIETFNRLIDDANRRIEAQERMDELKEKLNDGKLSISRKYTQSEWEHIYDSRFKKYIEDKVKNLKEILEVRQFEEQLNEEKFNEQSKPKKVAKEVIEASVNRMYSEAERRKLKINKKITEQFIKGKIKEDEQEREKEMEAMDYIPKKKQNCKYTFQSDTEKSDDENAYRFNKGVNVNKSKSKEKNSLNGLSKKQPVEKSVSKSKNKEKAAESKSKSKSKQKKSAKIINSKFI